ncbi:hypothetical protein Slala05_75950 [Streptomyces lavendulae subsp. lavendulae]|nr:hypothetical protein [Streptomyces lavendulae]GLW03965.1 hypothetical protein Slala05_75950 [Streptomyces lavendulae subsp. lavendulae]
MPPFLRGRACDPYAGGDGFLVLLFQDGVADVGVGGRHLRVSVPEDRHDRLDLGPAFGELGADRVAKPVGGHGGIAVAVDEPGLAAGDLQGVLVRGLAPPHEDVADRLLAGGTTEWQVRDGQLVMSPASARHHYLDE